MIKFGVADTTFSRVDMGKIAIETIRKLSPNSTIVRYTVPGIKDLPVAAAKLFEMGCDGVITLGWVGKTKLDKYSYLAASTGLINVQIYYKKHIMDVTIHEDESENEEGLLNIATDRARKHAENLVKLVIEGGEALTPYAGKGLRQGYNHAGPLRE
jgi:riboflavin synthase